MLRLLPPPPGGEVAGGPGRRGIVVAAAAIFAIQLLRTAWLSDDAYITARVVDNLWQGYGLRWNVDERVQAFTHPLWMMALAATHALVHDYYYAMLLLGASISIVALVGLLAGARSSCGAVVAGVVVLLSGSFVEYSTSGLENPLTHLLLLLFVFTYVDRPPRCTDRLFLLAGLLVLNRMDTLLLVAPCLADELRVGGRRALRAAAVGMSPFVAWELFSVLYYGFLFPNTAYAKLPTGVPVHELLVQGLCYFHDVAQRDPLTLLVAVIGALLPIAVGGRSLAVSIGIGLYLLYVLRIGGDFMTGRFFTAPLVVAAALLAKLEGWNRARTVGAVAVALIVGVFMPKELWWRGDVNPAVYANAQGIGDERAAYLPYTWIGQLSRTVSLPTGNLVPMGEAERKKGRHVLVEGWIGILGLYAGPETHIIDPLALTDPLLARLPPDPGWRIGHYKRTVPDGYEASVREDRNLIADPHVARLYDQLSAITRGPIFRAGRLRLIVKANLFGLR